MLDALGSEPPPHCPRCPRLARLRNELRRTEPDWFNGPVASFGEAATARLLIVGLAPGLKGANRTGRVFTGDGAGALLYSTLLAFGFAHGRYGGHAADGLALVETVITNAVKCVPPANKPTPAEIRNCSTFLGARIASMRNLGAIVALGRIAHDATLAHLPLNRSAVAFAHGARHDVGSGVVLYDSYHCSRYNISTGRLTPAMFASVFETVRLDLD